MNIDNDEQLRQKLAAIEHERWADWQKWCHKILCENLRYNDMETNLEEILERWERQIATPYADLSDKEKASDMEQVDRYWLLIQEYIAAQRQALRDEVEKLLVTSDQDSNGRYNLKIELQAAISTIFEGKEPK